VADRQRAGGKEPLTEREREALRELARALVRESGLAKDPEREAQLEGNKLQVEAAKTQVLISSGLLVGMAAVAGLVQTTVRLEWLFTAFILVLLSVIGGIGQIRGIAFKVARQETTGRAAPSMPLLTLTGALFAFVTFIISNLRGPGELTTPEIRTRSVIGGAGHRTALWCAVALTPDQDRTRVQEE
jgi:hypothetical protein